MYHQFKELAGLDITTTPMEVGPTTHYVMGGVRVDSDTQMSTVPGLFAAGECAGGFNGANRLGGNSLSDLLVFGRLAGIGACEYAASQSMPAVDEVQAAGIMRRATIILNRESGKNPFVIHEDLQAVMQRYVGIVREAADLQTALNEIDRLRAEADQVKAHPSSQYNAAWHEALDLRSLLL